MFKIRQKNAVKAILFSIILKFAFAKRPSCFSNIIGFHTSRPPAAQNNEQQLQWENQQQQHKRQADQLSSSSEEDSYLSWEEETDDRAISDYYVRDNPAYQQPTSHSISQKTRRRLFWLGSMEDYFMESHKDLLPRSKRRHKATTATTHKLRMEQWNITVQWTRGERKKNGLRTQRPPNMRLVFHENGFLRYQKPQDLTMNENVTTDEHSNTIATTEDYIVGTWRLAPSGLIWEMEMDGTAHTFYADLHLNPFGHYPKMFRGIVIRDRLDIPRKRFLRPIAATFSGIGDGIDTADFSYKNRGFGP